MKINAQSVNFNIDHTLLNFIQKKMDKLDLFYDKIIKADVYLKVENTNDKENKAFEVKQGRGVFIGTKSKSITSFYAFFN